MNLISAIQRLSGGIANTFSSSTKTDSQTDPCSSYSQPRWNQVRMRFFDGHTITIFINGKKTGCFSYGDLGMSDKRNGNPNRQWEMLKFFCNHYGQISFSNFPFSYNSWQRQSQLLSKRLKECFHLDGEPIEWLKEEKSYRCVFQIEPEK